MAGIAEIRPAWATTLDVGSSTRLIPVRHRPCTELRTPTTLGPPLRQFSMASFSPRTTQ